MACSRCTCWCARHPPERQSRQTPRRRLPARSPRQRRPRRRPCRRLSRGRSAPPRRRAPPKRARHPARRRRPRARHRPRPPRRPRPSPRRQRHRPGQLPRPRQPRRTRRQADTVTRTQTGACVPTKALPLGSARHPGAGLTEGARAKGGVLNNPHRRRISRLSPMPGMRSPRPASILAIGIDSGYWVSGGKGIASTPAGLRFSARKLTPLDFARVMGRYRPHAGARCAPGRLPRLAGSGAYPR